MTNFIIRLFLLLGLTYSSAVASATSTAIALDFNKLLISADGTIRDIDNKHVAKLEERGSGLFFYNLSDKPLQIKNIDLPVGVHFESTAPLVFETKLKCPSAVFNVIGGCTFKDGLDVQKGAQLEGGVYAFSGETKIPYLKGHCLDLRVTKEAKLTIGFLDELDVKRSVLNAGSFIITNGVLKTQRLSNYEGSIFNAKDLYIQTQNINNKGIFEVNRLQFLGDDCTFDCFETGKFIVKEMCNGRLKELNLQGFCDWDGYVTLYAKNTRLESVISTYCANIQTSEHLEVLEQGCFRVGKHLTLGTDKTCSFKGEIHLKSDPKGIGTFSLDTQGVLGQLESGVYIRAKDKIGHMGVVKADSGNIAFMSQNTFSDLDGFTQTGVFKQDILDIAAKHVDLFGKISINSTARLSAKEAVLDGQREGTGTLIVKVTEDLEQKKTDSNKIGDLHISAKNAHIAGQNHTKDNQVIKAAGDVIFEGTSDTKAGNLFVAADVIRDESGAKTDVKGAIQKQAEKSLILEEGSTSSAKTTQLKSSGDMAVMENLPVIQPNSRQKKP